MGCNSHGYVQENKKAHMKKDMLQRYMAKKSCAANSYGGDMQQCISSTSLCQWIEKGVTINCVHQEFQFIASTSQLSFMCICWEYIINCAAISHVFFFSASQKTTIVTPSHFAIQQRHNMPHLKFKCVALHNTMSSAHTILLWTSALTPQTRCIRSLQYIMTYNKYILQYPLFWF